MRPWPIDNADEVVFSWRILFWIDAAVLIGVPAPILLYPSLLLRRWYLSKKTTVPELISDDYKQLVLLFWVCSGLVAVLGVMALACAISPVVISGWMYLAFVLFHCGGFMLCFFHVLHADLYGFDRGLNTFWCLFNFSMALFYLIGTLGNVLWFPREWGEHPEYRGSAAEHGFGGRAQGPGIH